MTELKKAGKDWFWEYRNDLKCRYVVTCFPLGKVQNFACWCKAFDKLQLCSCLLFSFIYYSSWKDVHFGTFNITFFQEAHLCLSAVLLEDILAVKLLTLVWHNARQFEQQSDEN